MLACFGHAKKTDQVIDTVHNPRSGARAPSESLPCPLPPSESDDSTLHASRAGPAGLLAVFGHVLWDRVFLEKDSMKNIK